MVRLAVLALGVICSLALTRGVERRLTAGVQSRLEDDALQVAQLVSASMQRILIDAAALSGFFEGSDLVTPREFTAFTERFVHSDAQPGLIGAGYVRWRDHEGLGPPAATPLAPGDVSAPNVEAVAVGGKAHPGVFPEVLRNLADVDLAALERARRSGDPALLTGNLPPSARTAGGRSVSRALLAVSPLYRGKAGSLTAEERLVRHRGWAYLALDPAEFVYLTLDDAESRLGVAFFDDCQAETDGLLGRRYGPRTRENFLGQRYRRDQGLYLANHDWLLRVEALEAYVPKRERREPVFVLVAGLLFSTLVAAVVLLLTRGRAPALRLAAQRASALQHSEERHRSVVERLNEVIFEADADGRWTFLSPAWQGITGYAPQDCVGWSSLRWLSPSDRVTWEQRWQRLADGETSHLHAELRCRTRSRQERWLRVSVQAERDPDDGSMRGLVGTLQDITDAATVRQSNQRLVTVLEATTDVVATADRHGRLRWLNAAGRRLFGFPSTAATELPNALELFPEARRQQFLETAIPTAEREGSWSGDSELQRQDGEVVPVSQVLICHRDDHGEVAFYSTIVRDMSERARLEQRLTHQALHDPLTGLLNRELFVDRLSQALARSERNGTQLAVLFFDLDRFKVVNDSLGHSVGDELLRIVATRIQKALRAHDTAARLGGDEFVVLCEELQRPELAAEVAERLATAVCAPMTFDGRQLSVSASVGIAHAPPSEDAETLLLHADAAMYKAKERGGGQWLAFNDAIDAETRLRLDLQTRLRSAIDDGEFQLLYQPIVDVRTGRMTTVEALVRWRHPERGLLTPGAFIGLAEESGAIGELGAWVLRESGRQLAAWRRDTADAADLVVSVNLFPHQLRDENLPSLVSATLDEHDLPPEAFCLEITESALVDQSSVVGRTLATLRACGLRLAIDDFGTGYAPLTHLRELPAHIVKVDRSFVAGLGEVAADSAIVGSIVGLAQELGLALVAEGVERTEQLRWLADAGYSYAQGYWFAEPLRPAEMEALLRAGGRWNPAAWRTCPTVLATG
ncbi:MAG: bifunctional diguanylate cyclase/phosphodiesterase [Egibacteraceae bacterium]